jgi:hypothetical protein
MTPEEKLNKIKQQNKERARRYYLKNKEIITEKRHNKTPLKKPKQQPIKQPTKPENPYTANFYFNTQKTLFNILEIDDALNYNFNNYDDVIKKINETTHRDGATYSINSKKNFFQTILKMIDTGKISTNTPARNEYLKQYETLNIMSRDQTASRQKVETVLNFTDYLDKIKKEYGEISKEYLIALLYSFYSFRDDLILKIIQNEKQAKDEKINYIIITPRKKNAFIILNTYKTANKYGRDVVEIPENITKLFNIYIKNNNIKGFLFGSKPLSGFIKKMNNKKNLNITINTLRQMKVSENQDTTAGGRLTLSKMMKHAPTTSTQYKRAIL